LREHLNPVAEFTLPRPPLSLGKGHRALLLSAGYLDGVVRPPGEPPHVVRGTCRKVRYEKSHTQEENSDGSTTTTTVYGEKIVPTIRAVDSTGTIKTFDNAPAPADAAPEDDANSDNQGDHQDDE